MKEVSLRLVNFIRVFICRSRRDCKQTDLLRYTGEPINIPRDSTFYPVCIPARNEVSTALNHTSEQSGTNSKAFLAVFKGILVCVTFSLSLVCGLYSLFVMGNQPNKTSSSLLNECHCYNTMSQKRNNINHEIMAV